MKFASIFCIFCPIWLKFLTEDVHKNVLSMILMKIIAVKP